MSNKSKPKNTISSGGVIIKNINTEPYVLLIRDRRYNDWILPKGHVEPGETIEQAALREVSEEAGVVDVRIIKLLGTYQRFVLRANENKTIYYFLMQAGNSVNPINNLSTKKNEIKWHPLNDLPPMYLEEQRNILEKNREIIKDLT